MLSSPGVSEVMVDGGMKSLDGDPVPILPDPVPVEATAFLGAVAAFVVFLFVFFLYLNKKLCFYTVGGFPCCDDPVQRPDKLKHLGAAYSFEEEESSTDSEDEVIHRLSTSHSYPSALRDHHHYHHHHHNSHPSNYHHHSSNHHPHHHLNHHHHLASSSSNAATNATSTSIAQSSSSTSSHHNYHHNHAHHNHSHYNSHGYNSASSSAPYHNHNHNHNYRYGHSRSSSHFSAPDETIVSAERCDNYGCDASSDLISLAEKGRAGVGSSGGGGSGSGGGGGGGEEEPTSVGVAMSSSSASSSGSTTSGDDDLLTHRALRHRDPRAYRQMTPTAQSPTTQYEGAFHQECGDGEGGAETALLAKSGSLEAGFAYDLPTRTLTVHVLQAKDVPSKERGGATNTQVRVLLLPGRRQKQKTRIRPGENPQFNEAFVFNKINPEDVAHLGVRLRLYGCERMRRERLIGQVIVPFASINLAMDNTFWLTLEPRTSLAHAESRTDVCSLTRSDSTGSTHSVHGGAPELLLGLVYNGTTGRLAVEVIKGSHFRNMANTRAPDTYVKLSLLSSTGQEIAHSKTSVRRGQPSPLFKETFMFQVALFQLPDVTLMVTVFTKRSMKRKDTIGWFALGFNSSGEEELTHWNQMRDSKGDQVCRWHALVDP